MGNGNVEFSSRTVLSLSVIIFIISFLFLRVTIFLNSFSNLKV